MLLPFQHNRECNLKFYRYAAQRYTDSLMSMGNMRIGTLHDFRDLEHKKGVGDADEGKKSVTHKIYNLNERNIKEEHAPANDFFGMFKLGENTTLNVGEVTITKRYNHPDCFILCLSYERSRSVMSSLEGTDSCLELFGFNQFLNKVTEVLNELVPVDFLGAYFVTYQPREEDWNGRNGGIHPAFVKSVEYIDQAEARIVWTPKYGGPIKPIVINDIKLSKYFRHVDV